MMTGMARLPERQISTLMSDCLTPLLLAQVSPLPCPQIYNVPPGSWVEERRGIHCSLFSHCLSLFMTPPGWPGTLSDPPRDNLQSTVPWWRCLWKAHCPQRRGFLADHKTIASLPITLGGSAGLKFSCMRSHHNVASNIGARGVNNGHVWERGFDAWKCNNECWQHCLTSWGSVSNVVVDNCKHVASNGDVWSVLNRRHNNIQTQRFKSFYSGFFSLIWD